MEKGINHIALELEFAQHLIEKPAELLLAVANRAWLASFSFADAAARQELGIYLVDPQGYLMMRYPPNVEERGLIADIERLLKISKIG